jgi:hypothetical protein
MGRLQFFALSCLAASCAAAIDIPETPVGPNGRCTDKSLTIPSWTLLNYTVVDGTASFQVENRASERTSCCAFIECYPDREECQSSAVGDNVKVRWRKGGDGETVIDIREYWICNEGSARYVKSRRKSVRASLARVSAT